MQLGRRPREEVNIELLAFYRRLLQTIRTARLRETDWQLCELSGWPDNQSCGNIVAWCWSKQEERCLIAVNFSDHSAQALVRLPWDDLAGRTLRLTDLFNGDVYTRTGNEMLNPGLFVNLDAWGFHFLILTL